MRGGALRLSVRSRREERLRRLTSVRPLSIKSRLRLLVLVTAAPLIVFALGLVLWHGKTAQELLRQQAARTANAAMQAVDRELSGAITGLKVLAAAPALASGDLREFHEQAAAAVGIAGSSVIILYDRNGRRLVSTGAPYGTALPPRQDMSDLAVPFETGQPHVTPMFMSESVRRPTVGIVVPVQAQGEIRYVLGAGLLSDRLSELLKMSGVPGSWVGTLVDQHGTIIARTVNAQAVVGRKALPANWARIQSSRVQAGTFEGVTQEGKPVFLSFARSGTSGWTTVLGMPMAALQGPLYRSLSLVLVTGAGVLLLALLLALWASKHIYAPLQQLEDAAHALEDGRPLDTPSTGIEQFDRVGRAMQDAAHRIGEREARITRSLQDLSEAHEELRSEHAKKDQFIATLAHELRNPLAPVRTGLHVLARNPDEKVATRTLAMMERQLSHMVRLIDDLLDVSRIARGKLVLRKEDAVLQALVSHAADAAAPLLQAGNHRFTLDLPDEPVWVHADATRITQVITNLLNNAAKFTPPGGWIGVAVSGSGREAEVRVTDNGIGIPPERLRDVFDLFSQVKEEVHAGPPGLGIGLSLARRLVELHGGTIEASSQGRGEGATFVVRLPATTGPENMPLLQPPGRSGAGVPKRVLVVDDNIDAADALGTALRMGGHTAWVAHDGFGALELARQHDADLVLLDIGMPGMDGYELCRRLRALPAYAGRKIVALTGWGAANDREKARAAGFDEHLTKPVDWSQLERVLYGT